jgi:RNA polymerase sigma-70 factor (ECF subfamily)
MGGIIRISAIFTEGNRPAAARPGSSDDRHREGLLRRLAGADAAGRKDALGELYELTASRIYGFALGVLRDRGRAESVTQDVFIRIYEAAGKYSPQGKPLAWMFTIARNLALMMLRSKDNSAIWLPPEIEGAGAGETAAGSRGAYEESHEGVLLDTLTLRAALSLLGEDERQIVMLHSVGGMKHREIAEVMSLPISTVLSKYNRSLSKLRAHLGG